MNITKTENGYKGIVRIRGVQGKIVERRVFARTKELLKAEVEKVKAEIRNTPFCSLKTAEKFKTIISFYKETGGPKGPFCKSHTALIDLLEKELGEYPISDFQERFRRYLSLTKTGKSIAWYNRRIAVVKAAFNLAVESDLVKSNPITGKEFKQKKETARDIELSPEDISKIVLTAARNRRTCHIARYLQFLFQVPSRKTEIQQIKIGDVDLFNNCVRVRNGTTKTDKGTYKPCPPNMIRWFRRRVSIAKSLDEPVFCRFVRGSRKDRSGNNIQVKPLGCIKNAWDTVRVEAGFPTLRIHDTRHVSASQMIDNGTPSQIVQMIAGWNSDMLKVYYNRGQKQALKLVRFSHESNQNSGNCEGPVKEKAINNA
ncbi:MAG TPA: tyrosine-type recombinase/integrase [Chitinispirillaceae bacterium]|nr:tyrosine-type recombinase/integrase [Chitinispirillaceae bacterium]